MLRRASLRLRSIVLRRRLEREMQEEMAEHLERAAARLIARGLSAQEARRQAMREFGNVAWLQEQARDARGGRWAETLAADVRFALRHFGRRPGTTAVIVAVLAIGMSVSTSLFSFLRSYSVESPPGIPPAANLVRIRASESGPEGAGTRTFSRDELRGYESLTDVFGAVAGWADAGVTIDVGGDDGRRMHQGAATFVTDDYFAVLGVRPVLGAGLPAGGSAGGAPVGVISHAAWNDLFGRRRDVIGATLGVDGVPVTIVGVAPPRFVGGGILTPYKVWLPLSSRPLWVPDSEGDDEAFRAAARLRAGVSLARATSAVRVVAARAAAADDAPADALERRRTSDVVPLLAASGDPNFERKLRLMTVAFAGLALLVLLVTCTNVSALLTGLAMARRREIAIRLSMGAARRRIVRQLLTESVLLATTAGAAALGIVWLLHHAATALIPEMPFTVEVSAPAAAFTFAVALAAGVLFGLSPALHATRLTVASALKDSDAKVAGARGRLQRVLVVAQIAFTQPLIVGVVALALLLAGAYERQGLNDAGDRILSLRLRPAGAAAAARDPDAASSPERRDGIERLRERLERTPGIARAVLDPRYATTLDGYVAHPDDRVDGGTREPLRLSAPAVAPGYFAAMGIPLVLGREFAPADVRAAPARPGADLPVVIGQDLARRLWPGANPLGRRLLPPADSAASAPTLTVVGVVDRPADEDRTSGQGYRVYLPPDSARAAASLALLIRTTGPAQPLVPAIRAAAREELPGMTISSLRTVADMESEVRHAYYVTAAVLAVGGLLALFVAAIGLYAVVAFAVAQRTGEIAVRVAVGARARQIVGRFLGEGVWLGAIGVGVGLPLSLVGLWMLLAADPELPGVPLGWVGAAAAVGVLAVATAATWVPARKAAGVDPAIVLRRE